MLLLLPAVRIESEERRGETNKMARLMKCSPLEGRNDRKRYLSVRIPRRENFDGDDDDSHGGSDCGGEWENPFDIYLAFALAFVTRKGVAAAAMKASLAL